MKTALALAIVLVGLGSTRILAQSGPVPTGTPTLKATTAPADSGTEKLALFNLDFPGGTPLELVAAIERAQRRPLNAIVPKEYSDIQLPALKMNSVNVSRLFQALALASQRRQAVATGGFGSGGGGMGGGFGGRGLSYSIAATSYGFRAGDPRESDDTIWYFYVDQPASPPSEGAAKVCRFYSLTPYLDRRLTVDDITTAIETGWKMLGETARPTISFHKDTKLLIAVGEPAKLEIIDAALKALDVPKPAPAAVALPTPAPKRAEPAKNAE
jgi:hypothetical protein